MHRGTQNESAAASVQPAACSCGWCFSQQTRQFPVEARCAPLQSVSSIAAQSCGEGGGATLFPQYDQLSSIHRAPGSPSQSQPVQRLPALAPA